MEAKPCFLLACVLVSFGFAACHEVHSIPSAIMNSQDGSTCPSRERLGAVRNLLSNKVLAILADTEFACKGTGWKRVAFLNMSDPDQTCPDAWRLYEDGSVRACGRLQSPSGTCDSVRFSTGGFVYSEVCGRIRGYQFASPDTSGGPHNPNAPEEDINGPYLDGVSITHGNPRQHIWSLFGSVDIGRCCGEGHTNTVDIRYFIGNNSFCDSGNPDYQHWVDNFFTDHPLWDGVANCANSPSCCTLHPGPWFHATLPYISMQDIEVRVCGDQSTVDEDTPVELIEIYVK